MGESAPALCMLRRHIGKECQKQDSWLARTVSVNKQIKSLEPPNDVTKPFLNDQPINVEIMDSSACFRLTSEYVCDCVGRVRDVRREGNQAREMPPD